MPEVIAGRFELIEHIAQGGSGSVWLARDAHADALCAAKVMRQSYSGELLRFVREQGVKFEHEHLLSPYGWAAMDDQVVIASKLLRGGNLHTAMADYGAFSPELAAELLAQLLDALTHVHQAGWVHRDVKPANVLLEVTGTGVPHARLADFGIAAHRDDPRLTRMGFTVGTEAFLAPELKAGADPHPAGDLYALGILGLRLLGQAQAAEVPGVLGQVLGALTDPDPAVRVRMAVDMPALLAPLRNTRGYLTAAGDQFEVFDHFDEHAQQLPEAEPAPPTRKSAPDTPAPPAAPKAKPRAERSTPLPWLLAAAAVLLGALALWLVFGGSGAQPEGQRTTPPVSSPAAPTAAGTANPSPSGSASPSPTQDFAKSPTPTPTQSPLDVGISSNVAAGEACTALEGGLLVTGKDGDQLVCEHGAAGYQWHPASDN